jgi:5-hydroxyisourate hydrolase-like protein (transthyretin family)
LIQAPLYQQAFSFLRNRYNLSFHISDYYSKENWKLYGRAYQIFINGKQEIIEKSSSSSVKLYFTYEEAELACLVKLIEICKNK